MILKLCLLKKKKTCAQVSSFHPCPFPSLIPTWSHTNLRTHPGSRRSEIERGQVCCIFNKCHIPTHLNFIAARWDAGWVRAGSLARKPGFSSQRVHIPAVCPMTSYLIPLCLSFPIWKMELIVLGVNELIGVKCLGQCLTNSRPIGNNIS